MLVHHSTWLYLAMQQRRMISCRWQGGRACSDAGPRLSGDREWIFPVSYSMCSAVYNVQQRTVLLSSRLRSILAGYPKMRKTGGVLPPQWISLTHTPYCHRLLPPQFRAHSAGEASIFANQHHLLPRYQTLPQCLGLAPIR